MRVTAVLDDLGVASFERSFQLLVPGRMPVAYGMAARRVENTNASCNLLRAFVRGGIEILPMTDSWLSFKIETIT
jgi:NADPH:quinone reductase-like Zn-dependent oxidoreductase